jgi:hypothetical protein
MFHEAQSAVVHSQPFAKRIVVSRSGRDELLQILWLIPFSSFGVVVHVVFCFRFPRRRSRMLQAGSQEIPTEFDDILAFGTSS